MISKQLNNAYIVVYGRSAVGRSKKGALREIHPVDMGGLVLKGVLDKIPQLNREAIEDVIVGCAFPEGKQYQNIGRLIAARAGLGFGVPGMTLNRFCSSGLQAIDIAAMKIQTGAADCIVAGGLEHMSSIMKPDRAAENKWLHEQGLNYYISNGMTAENVADRFKISRVDMDAFAVESHRRAALAEEEGKFAPDIIPLPGLDKEGNPITFTIDECVRKGTNMEALSQLEPCFKQDGSVTAATSSPTSDGCGFVVLMSEKAVEKYHVTPIARFIGATAVGVDPEIMGIGPVFAVPKIMELTGLRIADMDVIELNEAFASQSLYCCRTLGFDSKKVNPNGGALALGHPLGGTGGIMTCKILSELKRTNGKYGLITMCVAGGMGMAAVVELL